MGFDFYVFWYIFGPKMIFKVLIFENPLDVIFWFDVEWPANPLDMIFWSFEDGVVTKTGNQWSKNMVKQKWPANPVPSYNIG